MERIEQALIEVNEPTPPAINPATDQQPAARDLDPPSDYGIRFELRERFFLGNGFVSGEIPRDPRLAKSHQDFLELSRLVDRYNPGYGTEKSVTDEDTERVNAEADRLLAQVERGISLEGLHFLRAFPQISRKVTPFSPLLRSWLIRIRLIDEHDEEIEKKDRAKGKGESDLSLFRQAMHGDREVAEKGIRLGWTDQDLADVLFFLRHLGSGEVIIPMTEEELPRYIFLTILHARQATRSFVFDAASSRLGITLARFVKTGDRQPVYAFFTSDGKQVLLGNEVTNYKRVQKAMYDQAGVSVPDPPDGVPDYWQRILAQLTRYVEVVSVSELYSQQVITEGLRAYLATACLETRSAAAIAANRPFLDGDRLFLHVKDARRVFSSSLRTLGFKRQKLSVRLTRQRTTSRKYLVVPAGVLQIEQRSNSVLQIEHQSLGAAEQEHT